jgi:GH25 family lysozyme M1 (1,4-beta-N-acetylmuramidase)
MWALPSRRLPRILTSVAGLGVVALIAFSAADAAGSDAAPSAPNHRSQHHRYHQRVSHFNVGATHSPKLLRELAGSDGATKKGVKKDAPGSPLGGALQGVDVAAYQHPGGQSINWHKAAKAGIQFASIKATEGTYYKNPYALADLAQARAAGISVMAYVFAIPNGNGGSSSAAAQADYLVKYLNSGGGELPPIMLDIEYNPYGAECYGLSQSAMVSWIAQFSREIQAKTGENPVIYGPGPWWQDCTGGTSRFGQFPLWVPDYTAAPQPLITAGWSHYSFWQYSSVGDVPGINAPGDTDLDQLNPAMIPLLDPGPQVSAAGGTADLQIQSADPISGQQLSFSAAGLPVGASISATGLITGWPVAAGNFDALVSASDSTGRSGSVSYPWAVGSAPSTGAIGPVQLGLGNECLTAGGGAAPQPTPTPSSTAPATPAPSSTAPATPAPSSTAQATPTPGSTAPAIPAPGPAVAGTPAEISTCTVGSSAQAWTYVQDSTLRMGNKCLTVPEAAQGAVPELERCTSATGQQWHLVYPRALNPAVGSHRTTLVNPWSGMCLADPGRNEVNGTKVKLWPCNGLADQAWSLPPGPVTSQIPGMCLDDSGNATADGTKIDIWGCNGSAAQAWLAEPDGTVRINGKCLDVATGATASGSPVDLFTCNGTKAQQWNATPAGAGVTLVNPASGMCLADPGDATADGTQAVIATCATGDPGMSWRAS